MRTTGVLLFTVSATLFLLDRFSHLLSSILGKTICRDRYLQPVDGMIGDMSCGFNLDMYLAAGLLLLCLAGGVLIYTSSPKKRTLNERNSSIPKESS